MCRPAPIGVLITLGTRWIAAAAPPPYESNQRGHKKHHKNSDNCALLHLLGTTRPSFLAQSVPNTWAPSSSSMVSALTVVGIRAVPHSVPDSIAISCSARIGPPMRQRRPTCMVAALIRLPSTEAPDSTINSFVVFALPSTRAPAPMCSLPRATTLPATTSPGRSRNPPLPECGRRVLEGRVSQREDRAR